MKKCLLKLAVLMMGAVLFTACDSDDDNTSSLTKPDFSNGLFIVGSGNQSNNIDGNLSYIDFKTGKVLSNVFQTVNGKSLGKTANYIANYGSKVYIVVDAEATIWVCDKATLKVLKQISTIDLLGEPVGLSPRAAVGADGMLYFTCYGNSKNTGNGVVAAIDTVNYEKQAVYAVGPCPDGVAAANGCIYVANSDYGKGQNQSISKINISTGTVTSITDAVITNPMHMLAAGGDVYCLDYGTYDYMDNYKQKGAGVRKITASDEVSVVADGTSMCTDGTNIYTVNAPYGADETTYQIYNTTTGEVESWEPENVFSPALIAADPVSGNIFIVSYQKDPDTGYPAYSLPSYTNRYDAQGNFVKKYENTATGAISTWFSAIVTE